MHSWEPAQRYAPGDKVRYHGRVYACQQGHTSQGDWAPDVTAALWGLCPDDDGGEHHGHGQHHQGQYGDQQYQQPPQQYQQQPYQQQQPGQQQQQQQQEQQQQQQQQQEPEKEEDQPWYKEHQTALGWAAAGLGAAAVIGAGYGIKKHYDNKEEKKNQFANFRTTQQYAEFRESERGKSENQGPVKWMLVKKEDINSCDLSRAILGRNENEKSDEILCVARAWHEGGLHPGKFRRGFDGAVIPFGGREETITTFEILVNNSKIEKPVDWININTLREGSKKYVLVDGGNEAAQNNRDEILLLFIARAEMGGSKHPGKVHERVLHGKDPNHKCAHIPFNGGEHEVENFDVLVYV